MEPVAMSCDDALYGAWLFSLITLITIDLFYVQR